MKMRMGKVARRHRIKEGEPVEGARLTRNQLRQYDWLLGSELVRHLRYCYPGLTTCAEEGLIIHEGKSEASA
jgi:hypothetical protein